jgi:dihydroorotase/N-acyl-D-amino-acid deacylase
VTPDAVLLTGGTLIDGTGAPGTRGDLLMSGGSIAELGTFEHPPDARRIDCSGMIVAPGFIDAHSHSDLQVLTDRLEKVWQGVTAEVVGNCGFSPYPAREHNRELREFANGIFCGDDRWGWRSAREYLDAAREHSRNATVASLVGHGTLRIAFAGSKLGPLRSGEVDAMEGCLREALEEGAAGFSTGLMYAPGSSAPTEELERLCRVVAQQDKIYATHMRSYSFGLEDAVDEQLNLARRTGCRLQISHLQTVGEMNWPNQARVIEKIELAREDGIDVAFDCYPYVAGSTVLTQLLPQSALDGGVSALIPRLRDARRRAEIAREVMDSFAHRWEDILISAVHTAENQKLVGLNLAEVSALRREAPLDAMMNVLVEENGEVNMITFNQSEENLRQTLAHPLSIVISDGFYVKGRPHPRLYGTFPRLLGAISREKQWMPLEIAIHKVTGKPAERFKFAQRGLLQEGYRADITVFDPKSVDSPATFENPEVAPTGIRHVFRNGREL